MLPIIIRKGILLAAMGAIALTCAIILISALASHTLTSS